jgi:hypothetical protein
MQPKGRRMKLKVLAVTLLAMFGLGGTAQAGFVPYPTITEHRAEGDVYQFMHHNYSEWRHKRVGYVDCSHGRINRFTWSCGVGWVAGRASCWQGRVRIVNEEYEGGVFYYNGIARFKPRC